VSLEVANETLDATATIVEGEERDRLWDDHVAELPWSPITRPRRGVSSRWSA
jgi:hypothetical protein